MGRDGRGERGRSWGERSRAETGRRRTERAGRRAVPAPSRPGEATATAAARDASLASLTTVVERTQELVRQLEAELQSERSVMSDRLEKLAAENRSLVERLREKHATRGVAEVAVSPVTPGRVSPFRRGQRGY